MTLTDIRPPEPSGAAAPEPHGRPAHVPLAAHSAASAASSAADAGLVARPRRLRTSPAMRALVRETRLTPQQLIAPLFVVPGSGIREAIPTLANQFRVSPDVAVDVARDLAARHVGGVLLFGVPTDKDPFGAGAADAGGPVPAALRAIRAANLLLVTIADVCLCEYTTHGHCGLLDGERIDNDATLPALAAAAVAYAQAGADIVAPSAMMDGQVRAIRAGLDAAGLHDASILAYASKHASAFYGPFRHAANSAPSFGDRRSYQMDAGNGREARREMALDVAEGADMLMVKPAITTLDLLAEARRRFDLPLAAYQVSGELAMLEHAAAADAIDRRRAALELLTAIARAGADMIVTYLAAEVAAWLRDPEARS
jgi:porphobilinogen synthase